MYTHAMMMYLYTETPLHAGSGQSVATVDLPIQREVTTNYPMIQASGIKGKLRAEAELEVGKNRAAEVFGPAQEDMQKGNSSGNAYAGSLSPGDAKLLLFPVRSLFGVFAWTTSRALLARFMRDYQAVTRKDVPWQLPAKFNVDEALVAADSQLKRKVSDGERIVLEEFNYKANTAGNVSEIGRWLADNAMPTEGAYAFWRESLPGRLVILPEEDFRDFANLSTQIATRIKINNETKTVDKENGALWTEESIPAETLMYVPIFASKSKHSSARDALSLIEQDMKLPRIQFGGDETVGRGLSAIRYGEVHTNE